MDNSEYQPTGAEIDDYKLMYGTDSIRGPWTSACYLGVVFLIIFAIGFILGALIF